VTHFLLLILVFLGVALYFMTPAERTRLFQATLAALHNVKDAVALEGLKGDQFFDALRARTPRVIAMPALIVLSTIVFVRSPVLDLFVSAMCLWQIGLILERLVGPLAFTTVYVASGVAAAIVNLSVSPGGMSVGPSASVLGMYGLLLVTSIWSMIQRSSLTIPLNVTKRLAQVAAIFVLYKLTTTGLWNVPALAALLCGLFGGIVVARDVDERTPQVRRLATAMATVVTVVTLYAVVVVHRPSNETVDVRPEIDRVLAVESRTAGLYDKEVERFRRGRITAAALADVIDKTIVPELHVVAGRLRALQDVPPEQKPLVASAEAFLKLRDESWQLRTMALHKSDMLGLQRADSKEQASREAFHRLNNMARVQNDAETLDQQPPVL
jgi:membrane associated rhomboid family serine protease